MRHVRQTNNIAINRLIAVSPGSNIYRTNKALIDVTGPIKWGHYQDKIMSNNNYNLGRSEFANAIGISVDTLKKRMKRGHHQDQYILKDGKYFFRLQEKDGPKQVSSPGTKSPVKKRNRGGHFDSKNPNYKPHFKRTNEIRMLAKLKHNIDQETQEVLPEAIEIAKQKKRERLQQKLHQTTPKNYGGMINRYNSTPLVNFSTSWTVLDPKPKDEYDKYLEDNDLTSSPTKRYY